ncbi:MAG: RNA polymerase sigma factor [Acidobacteriota bacterium]
MQGSRTVPAADRQETFRELVEQHSRMVFRVAYRITRNAQDAEDVVQEAFLRAYRGFDRFDARASFATWVFRIAANCAVDLLRSRRRRPESPQAVDDPDGPAPVSHDPSPEAASAGSEIGRRLSEALEDLTPQERAAFILRHFEGQPIGEIASILGLRAGAAKQAVFRAVRKLRLRLGPLREVAP